MIYQKTQTDELASVRTSDALLYAGTLGLLRVLTAVAMLVVLTLLAQAGLRPLPWAEPLPGWLFVVYLVGSAALYGAAYLPRLDNNTLVGVGLLFDLVMLTALSLFSGGALALFPLIAVLALSIHRTLWTGLLAALIYAAHLLLVWPPLGAFGQLAPPFQAGLLGLTLLVLILWVGLAASNNAHLMRDQSRLTAQRAKASVDRSRRFANRAKSIYNITYILSTTLSFESLVQSVFQELLRALPLDAGMVLLVDPASNRLKISSSHGLNKNELEQMADLRSGQLGRAVARGAPAIVNELAAETELASAWPRLAGCASAIVVPLRTRFELFGALLIFRQAGQYDHDDLELMGAIGNNTVVALQNGQLYQAVRDERDRLLGKEDEVRRQLGRELHDGPAQTLAVIAMKVEFIKKLLDLAPASGVRELDELGAMARKANQEVRGMLFDLRPAILESHGLVPALHNYVERFPAGEPPALSFQPDDMGVRLAPNVENTVFNIAQEAITNARKHAHARNVWISLRVFGDRLVLMVQDDGQGFDVAAQREIATKRGAYGLHTMRERATAIDGELQIGSDTGHGSTVTLSVPMRS